MCVRTYSLYEIFNNWPFHLKVKESVCKLQTAAMLHSCRGITSNSTFSTDTKYTRLEGWRGRIGYKLVVYVKVVYGLSFLLPWIYKLMTVLANKSTSTAFNLHVKQPSVTRHHAGNPACDWLTWSCLRSAANLMMAVEQENKRPVSLFLTVLKQFLFSISFVSGHVPSPDPPSAWKVFVCLSAKYCCHEWRSGEILIKLGSNHWLYSYN